MKTFLEDVLEQLLSEGLKPDDTCFVLPSKRAGFFLKHLLKERIEDTVFAPEILSIEDFIGKITRLRILDNTHTLFSFYNTYQELTPKEEQEEFDVFYGWAQTLVYDFNEIDRYLINTDSFFNYLSDIKDVEHWSVQPEQTDMVKKYLKFWRQLPHHHRAFVERLLKTGEAYQGLAYRKAAEQIEAFLQKDAKQYIFVGFNALNNAEQTLIQKILGAQRGRAFWDIDQYFLENRAHGAGFFMRQYQKWPLYAEKQHEFQWPSHHFTMPKYIESIGIPKNIGQAKYVAEILKKEDPKNTALVLNEESLLSPILNSLPETVEHLNVTMGLSLSMTPPAALFETLFKIQEESQKVLYYKHVLAVLNHSTIRLAMGQEAKNIQAQIAARNRVYLSKENLPPLEDAKSQKIIQLCFTLYENPKNFLAALIKLTKILKPEKTAEHQLETEYLYHFHEVFIKMRNLFERYSFRLNTKILHRIYKDTLQTASLDYSGSPTEGLQLMGMLETRVLDFETLILTTVNEGILPAGKSTNSFIPYDLKRAYKLPTYKEKDAVYTYHFYRLLQRAKRVYLLYNTDKSGVNSGEKSRFLSQLELQTLPKHEVVKKLINLRVKSPDHQLQTIEKTPDIIARLKEWAQRGVSPTALTTYIRNPIDFYKRYVLHIEEEEEVEETVAANTLGTVIHNTLENFYKPLENKTLRQTDLESMFSKIDVEVKRQFEEVYRQAPLAEGKNLIIFEIAKRYVYNFLCMEKGNITQHEIKILEIENGKNECELKIPGLDFPIKLKGKVDRVDQIDGQIRVVDYKTGKVEPSDLKLKNWEELLADYKYSKAFQVLCYSMMIQTDQSPKAGIISFKNLKKDFMPFIDQSLQPEENKINADVLASFHTILTRLFTEIFDIEQAFKEKEIEDANRKKY